MESWTCWWPWPSSGARNTVSSSEKGQSLPGSGEVNTWGEGQRNLSSFAESWVKAHENKDENANRSPHDSFRVSGFGGALPADGLSQFLPPTVGVVMKPQTLHERMSYREIKSPLTADKGLISDTIVIKYETTETRPKISAAQFCPKSLKTKNILLVREGLWDITQSSLGHREEFDGFGIRGKSRRFLQSSQDLSVL